MFAASDTFRAAAIEQLENWASKVDVQIVKSSQGADPASVAFKAVDEAIKNNFDQVLIDTAGRLQNKKNLMEEYKKIANVTKKIDPNAPHNVILVLDATSGQNVLNQVEEFNKIIPITGIVMTKLDGTAKGGILLALAKKYEIPIIALGLVFLSIKALIVAARSETDIPVVTPFPFKSIDTVKAVSCGSVFVPTIKFKPNLLEIFSVIGAQIRPLP